MTTTSPDTPEMHHISSEHVPDSVYVKVALWLAVLTAIEVFTYFQSVHGMSDTLLVILLLVLMTMKFVLVGAYFMHLKYDNPVFTRMFSFGLFLAIPVYFIFGFAFDWLPDWHWGVKVAMVVLPPMLAFTWLSVRPSSTDSS